MPERRVEFRRRWGPTSIRRFLDALIVPRVDKTYDAVFDLTPAEFDAYLKKDIEKWAEVVKVSGAKTQ